MQIGRKIYYELATGYVIVDTGERSGEVTETIAAQDFESFTALAERVPESVGCLQLAYGQYAQDFMECTSYRINPDSHKIEFKYNDPNPVYRPPLTVELEQLRAENTTLKSRIGDIEMFIADMIGGM